MTFVTLPGLFLIFIRVDHRSCRRLDNVQDLVLKINIFILIYFDILTSNVRIVKAVRDQKEHIFVEFFGLSE